VRDARSKHFDDHASDIMKIIGEPAYEHVYAMYFSAMTAKLKAGARGEIAIGFS
jgi:hypothetical protein